jgi:hypothetical protein
LEYPISEQTLDDEMSYCGEAALSPVDGIISYWIMVSKAYCPMIGAAKCKKAGFPLLF